MKELSPAKTKVGPNAASSVHAGAPDPQRQPPRARRAAPGRRARAVAVVSADTIAEADCFLVAACRLHCRYRGRFGLRGPVIIRQQVGRVRGAGVRRVGRLRRGVHGGRRPRGAPGERGPGGVPRVGRAGVGLADAVPDARRPGLPLRAPLPPRPPAPHRRLRGRRRHRAHLPPAPRLLRLRLRLRRRHGRLRRRLAPGPGAGRRGGALRREPGQRRGQGQAGADGGAGEEGGPAARGQGVLRAAVRPVPERRAARRVRAPGGRVRRGEEARRVRGGRAVGEHRRLRGEVLRRAAPRDGQVCRVGARRAAENPERRGRRSDAAEAAVELAQGDRRRRGPVRGRLGSGRRQSGDVEVCLVERWRCQGDSCRLREPGAGGHLIAGSFCILGFCRLHSI